MRAIVVVVFTVIGLSDAGAQDAGSAESKVDARAIRLSFAPAESGPPIRYRLTESVTTTRGRNVANERTVWEYSVLTKPRREGVRTQLDVRYESVSGAWSDGGSVVLSYESGKSLDESVGAAVRFIVSMNTQRIGRSVTVDVDESAYPVRVDGLFEILSEALSKSLFRGGIDPKKRFTERLCMLDVRRMIIPGPYGPRRVGERWESGTREAIPPQGESDLKCRSKWSTVSASVDRLTVESEFAVGRQDVGATSIESVAGSTRGVYLLCDGMISEYEKKAEWRFAKPELLSIASVATIVRVLPEARVVTPREGGAGDARDGVGDEKPK